jgi:hypothetical protein
MRAAWVSWLIWDHLAAVSFRFLYNALLRTEIVTRKVPMDTPLVLFTAGSPERILKRPIL